MGTGTVDLFTPPPGVPPAGNEMLDGPFWLVVCTEVMAGERFDLTRGYRRVHPSEKAAETEARRLAGLYRGYGFAVVRAVAIVRYDDKARRWRWSEC